MTLELCINPKIRAIVVKGSFTIPQAIINEYIRFTNMQKMKTTLTLIAAVCLLAMITSCSLFKPKYGCPTNGKNVGAEKLVSGDPDATKAAKKARKFKS